MNNNSTQMTQIKQINADFYGFAVIAGLASPNRTGLTRNPEGLNEVNPLALGIPAFAGMTALLEICENPSNLRHLRAKKFRVNSCN
jgi:hypothetical protein